MKGEGRGDYGGMRGKLTCSFIVSGLAVQSGSDRAFFLNFRRLMYVDIYIYIVSLFGFQRVAGRLGKGKSLLQGKIGIRCNLQAGKEVIWTRNA